MCQNFIKDGFEPKITAGASRCATNLALLSHPSVLLNSHPFFVDTVYDLNFTLQLPNPNIDGPLFWFLFCNGVISLEGYDIVFLMGFFNMVDWKKTTIYSMHCILWVDE
jgi:hypothetical protein